MHELLVPVGSYESLVAAINNGADAVYLGGKKFGARAYANNFTLPELENATKLCHLYGVKIYVTVNTLLYEKEIVEALNYVKCLHKMGVDALIMQDVGFINLVHQTLPNMEIHASTQMHNHSEESINFLQKLGIKRIVFARELPLDYINNIDTKLEKEVFIHGSLCVSYSGQCLFSSRVLNRSGNRGECAGLCRLPYELYENSVKCQTDGKYLLSPKDICSISNFEKLMTCNIKSFKIEGRMKSPDYVGIVTKIYRGLIDQFEKNQPLQVDMQDFELLQAIFNREYTSGFLFNDDNIMNFKAPNHQGIKLGRVTGVTKKYIKIHLIKDLHQFEGIRFKESNLGLTINFMYDKNHNLINKGLKNTDIYLDNFLGLNKLDEIVLTNPLVERKQYVTKKIPIKVEVFAKINQKLKIQVSDDVNQIILEKDYLVSKANKAPLLKERITEVMKKTGNTPFTITNIVINMDDNIFIPIGVLNNLRREVLNNLKDIRENKKVKYVEQEFSYKNKKMPITNSLNVLARNKEQIKALKEKGVENIIVINKELMEDNFIYRTTRDNLNHFYPYKNLLITDYASLDKYPHMMADYFLNVTNHYSLDYLSNYAKSIMLSPENTIENIQDIMRQCNNINVEVLIYGNIELMLMKKWPLNKIIKKTNVAADYNYHLKDRNNALYKLENYPETNSTVILDSQKINWLDKINVLKKIGVTNFRIELLEENYEETIKLIEKVESIRNE